MAESVEPGHVSNALPIRVIACPHCNRLTWDVRSRWGLRNWVLYTDLARISTTAAEPHPVAKCPLCAQCFWRDEAVAMGSLHPDRLSEAAELFGERRFAMTDTPGASDLEKAIVNGLPRFRSEIWRIHLMAWHRLNDDLRCESTDQITVNAMDEPIRLYVADAILKNMPNRKKLTRLLRIDILRQLGRFASAGDAARRLRLRVDKTRPGINSERLKRFYRVMTDRQIELAARKDRLPRPYELSAEDAVMYHGQEFQMFAVSGEEEPLRPIADPAAALWRRVEKNGWTCHNCGRGGRAGTDFTFDGRVICRHCGWPQ